VRDLEGGPIEKAKLELFRTAPNIKGRLLYSRLAEVRSDAQGGWGVQEVPPSLDGLVLQITHSDFRSNKFDLGDSNVIDRDALLASRVEIKLAPFIKIKESRQSAQPTSVPGQSAGRQGPSRPTQRPLAFSITENIEKPAIVQAPWASMPLIGWASIVFSGMLALVVAYYFWYRAVRIIGPTRTAMYSNLQPLFAVAMAWAMLGERPTIWQGVGAITIMTGLLLTRT